MTSDECLSFSDRFDTRQNALRPKRSFLLRRLLIHRLKNLAHCVGLGGLNSSDNADPKYRIWDMSNCTSMASGDCQFLGNFFDLNFISTTFERKSKVFVLFPDMSLVR